MKYTIIFSFLIFLIGCQSPNISDRTLEAEIKSENFLAGVKDTDSKGLAYIIRESAAPGYMPMNLGKIVSTLQNYRNDHLTGIKVMSELIKKTIKSMDDPHDVNALVDIQLMSYSSYDNFISKLTEDQSKYAANNLRDLMNHAEPIEWELLARALSMAQPDLTSQEYNRFRRYIINGINSTRENNLEGIDLNDPINARLLNSAEKAEDLLVSMK